MPRRRRRRANWPYRLAWCVIVASVVLYIAVGTLIGGLTYGHRSYGTDWWIAFVTTAMSATIATWFVAVGASLGSFLNVVAYRLPLGRTVGGHSGCPYCCSPIQRGDNVPVLAWIKLRGRCRNCRLPISAQYPLVEFLVAMVFLFVFVSEVARGGANLPSDRTTSAFPIYQLSVTPTLVMRLISYAAIMCGLVAAGLIAVKRQVVPLKLFAWSLVPLVVCSLIDPQVVIASWNSGTGLTAASGQSGGQRGGAVVSPDAGPIEARLNAVLTIVIGLAAGAMLAWLTSLLLHRGRREEAVDNQPATQAWIAGLAISGAMVGWQAAIPMTAIVILTWLIMQFLFHRYSDRLATYEPAVWIWLGLLLFRAMWRQLDDLQRLSGNTSELVRYAVGLTALLALSWLASRVPRTAIVASQTTAIPAGLDESLTTSAANEERSPENFTAAEPGTGTAAAVSGPTHTEKSPEPLT